MYVPSYQFNTNYYMMKKHYIFLFFSLISFFSYSQTDTEFWFVAPEVTYNHAPPGGEPIYLKFTTNELPATITIEMPKEPDFPDTTFSLASQTEHSFDLTPWIDLIENTWDELYDTLLPGKSNKGIHIMSTAPITAYYFIATHNNPGYYSLKGKNGLGSEFYTSFQTRMYNNNQNWTYPAYSSADVVVTEDDTYLEIVVPKNKSVFAGDGRPTLDGGATGSTYTLGPFYRGETFSFAPAFNYANLEAEVRDGSTVKYSSDKRFGRAGRDHLDGMIIRAKDGAGNYNKKIAVSLKDDSMKALVNTCYDFAGDQTIPTRMIGTEYIAMRGELTSHETKNESKYRYLYKPPVGAPPYDLLYSPGTLQNTIPINQETLHILATEDNTQVFINGIFEATIDDQETYIWEMTDPFTHVSTTMPSYVLHLTGFNCEIGEAILPPINGCTGSTKVSFTRATGDPDRFYMNIMARKSAKNGFRLNGVPWTPGTFTQINSTWSAIRVGPFPDSDFAPNTQYTISNDSDVFHLGLVNGNTRGGTKFAYFSDFNEFTNENESPLFQKDVRLCHGDPGILELKGSERPFIKWEPQEGLEDPYSPVTVVKTNKSTTYMGISKGFCDFPNDTTSILVDVAPPIKADFTIDSDSGCAPLNIKVKDKSLGVSHRYKWIYHEDSSFMYMDSTGNLGYDSIFNVLFDNVSGQLETDSIQLVVMNHNHCTDSLTKYVAINPRPRVSFSMDKDTGCQLLEVSFKLDSCLECSSFHWEFPDGSESLKSNPNYTFSNNSKKDSSYQVKFISSNILGCQTTLVKKVHVGVELDMDSIEHSRDIRLCHGDSARIFVDNDHFVKWTPVKGLKDPYAKSTIVNTLESILYKAHFSGACNKKDSIEILVDVSKPLKADFSLDQYSGCAPLNVLVKDESVGVNHHYEWRYKNELDLMYPDSTGINGYDSLIYLEYDNISGGLLIDTIQLVVINQNQCTDSLSRIIKIKPRPSISFAMDKDSGCNQLIINLSAEGCEGCGLLWNFGDGFISTEREPVHTFNNETGNDTIYDTKLTATSPGGCKTTVEKPVYLYYCDSVPMMMVDRETGVKIYPNPFKERIFIELKNDNEQVKSVKVINMNGIVIARSDIKTRERTLACDLKDIPRGTYLLQVATTSVVYNVMLVHE